MKSLIVLAVLALSLTGVASALQFAFTGNQRDAGTSITGVPLVSCEYSAPGYQPIWETFSQTSGCPFSIEVR